MRTLDAAVIGEPAFDLPHPFEPAASMRRIRRHIDPQSGRALEILGHAIEYLTDEYVHEFEREGRSSFSSRDGCLQAVQLLMAANRKIYFQCPEVKDWITRGLNFLRGRRHRQTETRVGN